MISVHWIPIHRGSVGNRADEQVFREWNPPFVKIVWDGSEVPYLSDIPSSAKIVWRNYPLSEQFHGGLRLDARSVNSRDLAPEPSQNGSGRDDYFPLQDSPSAAKLRALSVAADSLPTPEQAAEAYVENAVAVARYCEARGVTRDRLLFEGPNEYPVWVHGYEGLARLEATRLRGLHKNRLRGVIFNLGVGWPGNDGKDRPPLWEWARPAINEMLPGDYIGLHEYWAYEGPEQLWGWWAGRLLKCPYRVPILVTECGIDGGVLGASEAKKGWWDLPEPGLENKARRYIAELWRYAAALQADGRAQGLFVYSYDGNRNDWGRFDIRSEDFLRPFLDKVRTDGLPAPGNMMTPPPPPDEPLAAVLRRLAEAHDMLAVNPGAALVKAGAARKLWPTSNEFRFTHGGVSYVAQRFRDPASNKVYVLYCVDGKWDKVMASTYET